MNELKELMAWVLIAIIGILLCAFIFFTYQANYECKDAGAVMVKTLEGGVCMKGATN